MALVLGTLRTKLGIGKTIEERKKRKLQIKGTVYSGGILVTTFIADIYEKAISSSKS